MVFYTCGPNKVMVVSGACFARPRYIVGGRTIAIPIIHRVQKLPLSIFTLTVRSDKVYTKLGVPVTVTGIAQVKVASNSREILEAACKQLLGKSKEDIKRVAQETVEGHQRAIMGLMSIEEIITDRKVFAEKVFEVAATDLLNMGFTIVSYTLKEVKDSEGYLHSLGEKRTAEIKKNARMGQASAQMEATIKEAQAEEIQRTEIYKSEMGIAKAKRDFELEKAGYDAQVNAARAQAELAYQLAAAKLQQLIKEEEMNVEIVEREQAIALMQQETLRRERELDATVRRPADAAKFETETAASATRDRRMLEAEADASAARMQGDAEAEVIRSKGRAEAGQMNERAAAFVQYGDAALVDMYLQALPKIAAEVASNLAKDGQSVKMISVGDGEVGMSRFVAEVNKIVADLPRLVQSMTGVDVNRPSTSKE